MNQNELHFKEKRSIMYLTLDHHISMRFTMVLHISVWLKINEPKQVGEWWSTRENLSNPYPHKHQLQTHTVFLLLWGFRGCGAAEYTEIRCNCEPLSTAGTVDHMKHVASSAETWQGCAIDGSLTGVAVVRLRQREWKNSDEITLWDPVQKETFYDGRKTVSLFLRK